MNNDEDYGLMWLDAWIECCDKALANFLLIAEFGEDQEARLFLAQFKTAKQHAIDNMKSRRNYDLL